MIINENGHGNKPQAPEQVKAPEPKAKKDAK